MGTNKDLVQSFKMTTIRNSFGVYGQRTIIRLIEASQYLLEGKTIGDCVTYEIDKKNKQRNSLKSLFLYHWNMKPPTGIGLLLLLFQKLCLVKQRGKLLSLYSRKYGKLYWIFQRVLDALS